MAARPSFARLKVCLSIGLSAVIPCPIRQADRWIGYPSAEGNNVTRTDRMLLERSSVPTGSVVIDCPVPGVPPSPFMRRPLPQGPTAEPVRRTVHNPSIGGDIHGPRYVLSTAPTPCSSVAILPVVRERVHGCMQYVRSLRQPRTRAGLLAIFLEQEGIRSLCNSHSHPAEGPPGMFVGQVSLGNARTRYISTCAFFLPLGYLSTISKPACFAHVLD
jgi:hypothetical protein